MEKLRLPSPKTSLAIAVSALVVGIGIAATASAGAATNHASVAKASAKTTAVKVVHACESKKTHVLKDAPKAKCGKGWAKMAWDVKGVKGSTGKTGATGKTGPVGPVGIAAVNVVQTTTTNVLGSADGEASAWCAAGQTVLSGGVDSDNSLVSVDSFPNLSQTDVQGWTASVNNLTLLPHTFHVYAVCATLGS